MTTIQLRYKIEQDKVPRKTQWLCWLIGCQGNPV